MGPEPPPAQPLPGAVTTIGAVVVSVVSLPGMMTSGASQNIHLPLRQVSSPG